LLVTQKPSKTANLLNKSKENYDTASWAETSGYYNAAVSRYYYCLYEKAIYIAKVKGFYRPPEPDKGTHNKFIENFQKSVFDKLEPADVTWLSKFSALKGHRIKADYYEESCFPDKNQFILCFKYFFTEINRVLDKLAC
jgi:hypothetical protein